MSISQQLYVMTHQKDAFKVYLYHKDRRVTQHIVVPREGKFKIKGNGYVINSDRVFFEKRVPTAIYSASIAEPINPLDINEKSTLSSQDFYNAIEATVVQDIIRASTKQDNTMLMMVVLLGGCTVMAMAVGVYYISNIIAAQSAQITVLTAAVDALKAALSNISNTGGTGAW